jgi:hypothetical protein
MIESLSCPNCGAPLRQPVPKDTWVCVYCNSLIRMQPGQSQAVLHTSLDAGGMNEIKQLLVSGQRADAVQRFQRLSGLAAEQAEAAIDQMAADFSIHTLYQQQLTPVGILMVSLSLIIFPASLLAWWMGRLNPWLAAAMAITDSFGLFVYGRGGLTTLRYWNAPTAPAATLQFTQIGAVKLGRTRLHTFLILLEVRPKDAPAFQARAIIPVREENVARIHQGEIIQVKYLPGNPDSVIFHQS